MKPNRLLPLLALVAFAGCQRPPVGIYQTRDHSGVEFVRRPGGPLLMDVFEPIGAPEPRPAVLLLHPGGWAAGTRKEMRPLARFLASLGYTAATADYRLWSNHNRYPAAVQDSLAAVKFLRASADKYKIDPDRIAVAGESAGGALALLVGLAKDPDVFGDDSFPGVWPAVAAVVDVYGPTDMPRLHKDAVWLVKQIAVGYIGAPPPEMPQKWKESSPVAHLRADAPPILIVHGDRDWVVPYSQAELLDKKLTEIGATHYLVKVPGAGHGWGSHFNHVENQRTLAVITHFLAQTLALKQPHPPTQTRPASLE